MNKKIINKIGFVFSAVIFIVSMLVLYRELREYHYQDIIDSIRATPRIKLIFAGIYTLLSFYFMTLYEVFAFRSINHPLKFKKIGFTSFIANAFSHILGFAVVTGSLVRFRQYTSWGLSVLEISNTMIIRTISFWLGFFLVCGSLFILQNKAIAGLPYTHFQSARYVGIVCLLLVLGYLVWNRFVRQITIKKTTVKLPSCQFSIIQIIISAVDWVLLALVLYVLMPATLSISYPQFFTIFFVAQIGGFISNVPGGLGVFELIVISLFPSQVPASQLMGSLILYRFIYYLFPMGFAMLMLGIYEASVLKGFAKRLTAYIGGWTTGLMSPVFSSAVFVAGIILIFSGATPTLEWRLELLQRFIPMPVMETAYIMGSVSSVILMFEARGLFYRQKSSYTAVLAVLCGGIVFSLLKGFDYEEALLLSTIVIAFIPSRWYFCRQSFEINEKFTFGWVAATGLVIISSLWLGFFSNKQLVYSHHLWWAFGFSDYASDASRFLRSSAGAVITFIIMALIKLFRQPAYAAPLPREDELPD